MDGLSFSFVLDQETDIFQEKPSGFEQWHSSLQWTRAAGRVESSFGLSERRRALWLSTLFLSPTSFSIFGLKMALSASRPPARWSPDHDRENIQTGDLTSGTAWSSESRYLSLHVAQVRSHVEVPRVPVSLEHSGPRSVPRRSQRCPLQRRARLPGSRSCLLRLSSPGLRGPLFRSLARLLLSDVLLRRCRTFA